MAANTHTFVYLEKKKNSILAGHITHKRCSICPNINYLFCEHPKQEI